MHVLQILTSPWEMRSMSLPMWRQNGGRRRNATYACFLRDIRHSSARCSGRSEVLSSFCAWTEWRKLLCRMTMLKSWAEARAVEASATFVVRYVMPLERNLCRRTINLDSIGSTRSTLITFVSYQYVTCSQISWKYATRRMRKCWFCVFRILPFCECNIISKPNALSTCDTNFSRECLESAHEYDWPQDFHMRAWLPHWRSRYCR